MYRTNSDELENDEQLVRPLPVDLGRPLSNACKNELAKDDGTVHQAEEESTQLGSNILTNPDR